MLDDINTWLKSLGIKDFDDLRDDEKDDYFKLLNLAESSKVTLEDVKKHVRNMRMAVESSLVDEEEYVYSEIFPFFKRRNNKILMLQARLKNYILFENIFDRPEKAKQMLQTYTKGRGGVTK